MGDEPDPEPEPKAFTQEDVNRLLARDRKKFDKELAARPTNEAFSELEAKFTTLTDEADMAGKSGIEKLQVQHTREMEKLGLKYGQLEDQLKAHDEAATAAKAETHRLRMRTAFGAALAKAGVFTGGAKHALDVLLAEVKDAELADNGNVRASYGSEMIDEGPEAIAKKFLEDSPHFAAAKAGGAGTTPPNGTARTQGKSVADMTMDEIWEDAGQHPPAQR